MKSSVCSMFLATFLAGLAPLASEPQPEPASGWTQFGGHGGLFTSEATELAARWPSQGPSVLWEQVLGGGHASPVADTEMVVAFHRRGDEEVVSTFALGDGQPIWSKSYTSTEREGNLKQFGLGPHATPVLLSDSVVTLGYGGALQSRSRKTGELLWSHNLIEDFGGRVMRWGYTASPILHDGRLIVLVGGDKAGAMAFDPATGAVIWQGPKTTVSHAPATVMSFAGEQQLLYYSDDALHALDPASGASLWSFEIKNQYANHSTMPLWRQDGLVIATTQLEGGTRALQLSTPEGGTQATEVEQLWFNNKVKVHFWNALRLGNTFYAMTGDKVQVLVAVDVESGEILWRERGFSQANLLQTPVGTLLLDDSGELALVKLSRKGLQVVSRSQVFDSTVWAPPALVGSTLLARDKNRLRAVDLGNPRNQ